MGGPLINYWRRQIAPTLGPWEVIGESCDPNSTPPAGPGDVAPPPPKPQLTLAMIRTAWSQTPFAVTTASIQPPNGRTLIRLPTYFQVTWPAAGYQPGEIRTVTLLGHQVRIKPTLVTYTYVFGDGSSVMSADPGGPWPDGKITHTYTAAGTVTPRIDTAYGGQFSVDGGEWIDIDGSVSVAGTGQPLTVLTAKNRLSNGSTS